jgi:ABC-type uncharacterized transport system auxiliary subunit
MLFKSLSLVAMLTGTAVLSGCAFTADRLDVNTQMRQPVTAATRAPSNTAIAVANIRDARGLSNPFILAHKKNGLGDQASGSYQLKQPVAKVFTSMLKSSLKSQHYNLKNRANLQLKGSIINTSLQARDGFVSASMLAKFQVNMRLVNKKTGAILWTRVFTGRDNPSDNKNTVYFSLTGDSEIGSAFVGAMRHAIISIEKSHGFKRAVKRFK